MLFRHLSTQERTPSESSSTRRFQQSLALSQAHRTGMERSRSMISGIGVNILAADRATRVPRHPAMRGLDNQHKACSQGRMSHPGNSRSTCLPDISANVDHPLVRTKVVVDCKAHFPSLSNPKERTSWTHVQKRAVPHEQGNPR